MSRHVAGAAEVIVGRDAELGRLRALLDAVRRGGAGFVLGEPGAGKTRLLAALTLQARQRGLPVLVAAGSDVAPLPAYGLVAQALRSVVGRDVGSACSGLDRFVPGLRQVFPELTGPPPSDFTADQLRLLAADGTLALLHRLARGGVVIVIDDLQWADPESLDVVRRVVGAVSEVPALLVAAVRTWEDSPAEALARRLAGQCSAELITLAPLAPPDIGVLVEHLLGAAAPDELVTRVADRSAGLPLLVEEVVHCYLDAGSFAGPGTPLVPASMAGLVQVRLDRLGPGDRAVIDAAAVLGRFDDVLVDVLGSDRDAVHAALRRAITVGLLDPPPDLRFHHALVRDAVVGSLLPAERAALHRRCAAVLADRSGSAEEQAHHRAAVGETAAAARLLVTAARDNLVARALESAEALARRALGLATGKDVVDEARDVLSACLCGQGRWTESLALDRQLLAGRGFAQTVLARVAECALHSGRTEEARAVLARGLAGSAVLEAVVALHGGELDRAVQLAGSALVDARATGDPATACICLDVTYRAYEYLGRLDDAAAVLREWSDVATSAGAAAARLHALVSLGGRQLLAGQPVSALWEARALALQTSSALQLAWANLSLVYIVTWAQPISEALVFADEAVAHCRRYGLDVLAHTLVAAANAHAVVDEAVAVELLAQAHALAAEDDDLITIDSYFAGQRAFTRGDYDLAARTWRHCVARMQARPADAPSDAPAVLAVALLAAGRLEEAKSALDDAARWPDRRTAYAQDAMAGLAAALLDGRADRVVPSLEALRAPEPCYRAAALVAAARVLPGEHAVNWLTEALEQYRRSGWEPAAQRVRRLLRVAGAPVPRSRRPAATAPDHLRRRGVTEREADTLALVAGGHTNVEIAARLFISVRTVESHVSSLLAKLGAPTRAALVARYLTHVTGE